MGRTLLFAVLLWGGACCGARADELLLFVMDGCRPCAKLKALLDAHPELAAEFKLAPVDITVQPEVAKLFQVKSVPTIVRLDEQDREVGRLTGAPTYREFQHWLRRDPRN